MLSPFCRAASCCRKTGSTFAHDALDTAAHHLGSKVPETHFCRLMIERNLFGTILLVRTWGRVGTKGQELIDVFATEADQALEAVAWAKR
jgi:hypothetical protein